MIITKKALSRRTILRGMGAALALPYLDAMVPAFASPKRILRFGAVYVPNGMSLPHFVPKSAGPGFELSPTLQALAPHRDQLVVFSGISNLAANSLPTEGVGDHSRACGGFLTCAHIKKTEGSDIKAGMSIDQIAAQELGKETQL